MYKPFETQQSRVGNFIFDDNQCPSSTIETIILDDSQQAKEDISITYVDSAASKHFSLTQFQQRFEVLQNGISKEAEIQYRAIEQERDKNKQAFENTLAELNQEEQNWVASCGSIEQLLKQQKIDESQINAVHLDMSEFLKQYGIIHVTSDNQEQVVERVDNYNQQTTLDKYHSDAEADIEQKLIQQGYFNINRVLNKEIEYRTRWIAMFESFDNEVKRLDQEIAQEVVKLSNNDKDVKVFIDEVGDVNAKFAEQKKLNEKLENDLAENNRKLTAAVKIDFPLDSDAALLKSNLENDIERLKFNQKQHKDQLGKDLLAHGAFEIKLQINLGATEIFINNALQKRTSSLAQFSPGLLFMQINADDGQALSYQIFDFAKLASLRLAISAVSQFPDNTISVLVMENPAYVKLICKKSYRFFIWDIPYVYVANSYNEMTLAGFERSQYNRVSSVDQHALSNFKKMLTNKGAKRATSINDDQGMVWYFIKGITEEESKEGVVKYDIYREKAYARLRTISISYDTPKRALRQKYEEKEQEINSRIDGIRAEIAAVFDAGAASHKKNIEELKRFSEQLPLDITRVSTSVGILFRIGELQTLRKSNVEMSLNFESKIQQSNKTIASLEKQVTGEEPLATQEDVVTENAKEFDIDKMRLLQQSLNVNQAKLRATKTMLKAYSDELVLSVESGTASEKAFKSSITARKEKLQVNYSEKQELLDAEFNKIKQSNRNNALYVNQIKDLDLLANGIVLSGWRCPEMLNELERFIVALLQSALDSKNVYILASDKNAEMPKTYTQHITFIIEKAGLIGQTFVDEQAVKKILNVINLHYRTDEESISLSWIQDKNNTVFSSKSTLTKHLEVAKINGEYFLLKPATEVYSDKVYFAELNKRLLLSEMALKLLVKLQFHNFANKAIQDAADSELSNFAQTFTMQLRSLNSFAEFFSTIQKMELHESGYSALENCVSRLAKLEESAKLKPAAIQQNFYQFRVLFSTIMHELINNELLARGNAQSRLLDSDPIKELERKLFEKMQAINATNATITAEKAKLLDKGAQIQEIDRAEIELNKTHTERMDQVSKQLRDLQGDIITTNGTATLFEDKVKTEKNASCKAQESVDQNQVLKNKLREEIQKLRSDKNKFEGESRILHNKVYEYGVRQGEHTKLENEAKTNHGNAKKNADRLKKVKEFFNELHEIVAKNENVFRDRKAIIKKLSNLKDLQDIESLYNYIVSLNDFKNLNNSEYESAVIQTPEYFPDIINMLTYQLRDPEFVYNPSARTIVFKGFNLSWQDAYNIMRNILNEQLELIGLRLTGNTVRVQTTRFNIEDLPDNLERLVKAYIVTIFRPTKSEKVNSHPQWLAMQAREKQAIELFNALCLTFEEVLPIFFDRVELVAGNMLFVEENINLPGIDLTLYSHGKIILKENCQINTSTGSALEYGNSFRCPQELESSENQEFQNQSAREGKTYRVNNEKPVGHDGEDGLDGIAAASAGNIYLNSKTEIVSVDSLKCIATGGKGANGQAGGAGDKGREGLPTDNAKPRMCETLQSGWLFFADSGGECLIVADAPIPGIDGYTHDGKPILNPDAVSGPGGHGGLRGHPGEGGKQGEITVVQAKVLPNEIVAKFDKKDGLGGKIPAAAFGGEAGEAGFMGFPSYNKRTVERRWWGKVNWQNHGPFVVNVDIKEYGEWCETSRRSGRGGCKYNGFKKGLYSVQYTKYHNIDYDFSKALDIKRSSLNPLSRNQENRDKIPVEKFRENNPLSEHGLSRYAVKHLNLAEDQEYRQRLNSASNTLAHVVAHAEALKKLTDAEKAQETLAETHWQAMELHGAAIKKLGDDIKIASTAKLGLDKKASDLRTKIDDVQSQIDTRINLDSELIQELLNKNEALIAAENNLLSEQKKLAELIIKLSSIQQKVEGPLKATYTTLLDQLQKASVVVTGLHGQIQKVLDEKLELFALQKNEHEDINRRLTELLQQQRAIKQSVEESSAYRVKIAEIVEQHEEVQEQEQHKIMTDVDSEEAGQSKQPKRPMYSASTLTSDSTDYTSHLIDNYERIMGKVPEIPEPLLMLAEMVKIDLNEYIEPISLFAKAAYSASDYFFKTTLFSDEKLSRTQKKAVVYFRFIHGITQWLDAIPTMQRIQIPKLWNCVLVLGRQIDAMPEKVKELVLPGYKQLQYAAQQVSNRVLIKKITDDLHLRNQTLTTSETTEIESKVKQVFYYADDNRELSFESEAHFKLHFYENFLLNFVYQQFIPLQDIDTLPPIYSYNDKNQETIRGYFRYIINEFKIPHDELQSVDQLYYIICRHIQKIKTQHLTAPEIGFQQSFKQYQTLINEGGKHCLSFPQKHHIVMRVFYLIANDYLAMASSVFKADSQESAKQIVAQLYQYVVTLILLEKNKIIDKTEISVALIKVVKQLNLQNQRCGELLIELSAMSVDAEPAGYVKHAIIEASDILALLVDVTQSGNTLTSSFKKEYLEAIQGDKQLDELVSNLYDMKSAALKTRLDERPAHIKKDQWNALTSAFANCFQLSFKVREFIGPELAAGLLMILEEHINSLKEDNIDEIKSAINSLNPVIYNHLFQYLSNQILNLHQDYSIDNIVLLLRHLGDNRKKLNDLLARAVLVLIDGALPLHTQLAGTIEQWVSEQKTALWVTNSAEVEREVWISMLDQIDNTLDPIYLNKLTTVINDKKEKALTGLYILDGVYEAINRYSDFYNARDDMDSDNQVNKKRFALHVLKRITMKGLKPEEKPIKELIAWYNDLMINRNELQQLFQKVVSIDESSGASNALALLKERIVTPKTVTELIGVWLNAIKVSSYLLTVENLSKNAWILDLFVVSSKFLNILFIDDAEQQKQMVEIAETLKKQSIQIYACIEETGGGQEDARLSSLEKVDQFCSVIYASAYHLTMYKHMNVLEAEFSNQLRHNQYIGVLKEVSHAHMNQLGSQFRAMRLTHSRQRSQLTEAIIQYVEASSENNYNSLKDNVSAEISKEQAYLRQQKEEADLSVVFKLLDDIQKEPQSKHIRDYVAELHARLFMVDWKINELDAIASKLLSLTDQNVAGIYVGLYLSQTIKALALIFVTAFTTALKSSKEFSNYLTAAKELSLLVEEQPRRALIAAQTFAKDFGVRVSFDNDVESLMKLTFNASAPMIELTTEMVGQQLEQKTLSKPQLLDIGFLLLMVEFHSKKADIINVIANKLYQPYLNNTLSSVLQNLFLDCYVSECTKLFESKVKEMDWHVRIYQLTQYLREKAVDKNLPSQKEYFTALEFFKAFFTANSEKVENVQALMNEYLKNADFTPDTLYSMLGNVERLYARKLNQEVLKNLMVGHHPEAWFAEIKSNYWKLHLMPRLFSEKIQKYLDS